MLVPVTDTRVLFCVLKKGMCTTLENPKSNPTLNLIKCQVQFNKTREHEEEEGKLREQLKAIDQQIKKLKQSSKSSSKQGDEIQALADARRWAASFSVNRVNANTMQ